LEGIILVRHVAQKDVTLMLVVGSAVVVQILFQMHAIAILRLEVQAPLVQLVQQVQPEQLEQLEQLDQPEQLEQLEQLDQPEQLVQQALSLEQLVQQALSLEQQEPLEPQDQLVLPDQRELGLQQLQICQLVLLGIRLSQKIPAIAHML
jgi:hypothetical protein